MKAMKFVKSIPMALGILILGQAAIAHPEPEDPITMLPVGTKIVVTQDINIKPGTLAYVLGGNLNICDNLEEHKYTIDFNLKTESDNDRVLKAGSVLVLKERLKYVGNYKGEARVDGPAFSSMSFWSNRKCELSIGMFTEALKKNGHLTMVLPEPEVISDDIAVPNKNYERRIENDDGSVTFVRPKFNYGPDGSPVGFDYLKSDSSAICRLFGFKYALIESCEIPVKGMNGVVINSKGVLVGLQQGSSVYLNLTCREKID